MNSPEKKPVERPQTFAELLGEQAEGRPVAVGEIASVLQVYVDAGAAIPSNEVWGLIKGIELTASPADLKTLKDIAAKGENMGDSRVADTYALLLEHMNALKPKE